MGGMYPARNILGMGLVAMAYFRMAGTGRPIWAYNPKTNTIFLAPDDAGNAEGIAGQVWASGQTLTVDDFPEITERASDDQIAEYAKKTFVSEVWVRKRMGKRTLSRSIAGIPVEVKNELWGVLILDSLRPSSIKTTGKAWGHYEQLIPFFLNELLR
jgi:GAF domain